jgi:hypothetical protein
MATLWHYGIKDAVHFIFDHTKGVTIGEYYNEPIDCMRDGQTLSKVPRNVVQ